MNQRVRVALWLNLVGTSACFVTEVPFDFSNQVDASLDIAVQVDVPDAEAASMPPPDINLTDHVDVSSDREWDVGADSSWAFCNGLHVNIRMDSRHCGRCNSDCFSLTLGDAGVTAGECQNGRCVAVGCGDGLVTNLSRDACLRCGTATAQACTNPQGSWCRTDGPGRLQNTLGWCLLCGASGQPPCYLSPSGGSPCDPGLMAFPSPSTPVFREICTSLKEF